MFYDDQVYSFSYITLLSLFDILWFWNMELQESLKYKNNYELSRYSMLETRKLRNLSIGLSYWIITIVY